MGFSGIIWDEKFPGTVYSTKHYGDTFDRPLSPLEIGGVTYLFRHNNSGKASERRYQNEKKKEEYYDDLEKQKKQQ